MFQRFGTEVTVFEMLPRMVPVEDEDISKELERNFRSRRSAWKPARARRTFARPARACS